MDERNLVHLISLRGDSSLGSLDAAVEYLRERSAAVLPAYVVAMAPLSVAVLMMIDAMSSQDRRALPAACMLATLGCFWRWGWLAVVQRRVQEDLRGEPVRPLRSRLLDIIVVRLLSCVALTWGGLLILPSAYGLFYSGLATPLLLEHEGPVLPLLVRAGSWMTTAVGRLSKLSLALTMGLAMAALSIIAAHAMLIGTILPSLLGMNAVDLRLTVISLPWALSGCYFLFLAFDFYWTVASVILFYDVQSQRLGTDLRLRLRILKEAP